MAALANLWLIAWRERVCKVFASTIKNKKWKTKRPHFQYCRVWVFRMITWTSPFLNSPYCVKSPPSMCPEMPDVVYGDVQIQRLTNHFPHGVFLSFLTLTLVCLPQVCAGWLSHDQEAGGADARTKHHPCAHHQPWAGQQGRHDPRDQGPTRSNKVQEESWTHISVGTSCALVKAICGMSMGWVLGTVHWTLGHFRDGCQLHCAQPQRRAGRVWLAFCCMSSTVINSQELWSGSTADNDTKLLIQAWSRLQMLMLQSAPQAELSQVWAPTQAVMYLALRTWYGEKTEREEWKEREGGGGRGGGGRQTERKKTTLCVWCDP